MKPTNLAQLRDSGWKSKTVKQEIYDNFLAALAKGDELYPGMVGYQDTVIPELNIALLSGHDLLFLGEKGQGKSRLMRTLVRFLDDEIPFLDVPGIPLHDDPYAPITLVGKKFVAEHSEEEIPIGWWRKEDRYAERLAPGTKFADIVGEIDPAKLAGGVSMSAEEALHFGLIPRMHRGIFAINELPELDELVQVGLFNILEERDVQIRGYPVRFDIGNLQPQRKGDSAIEGPDWLGHSHALSPRARLGNRHHGTRVRHSTGWGLSGDCALLHAADH